MNVFLLDNDLLFLKSFELILRGRGHDVISFSNPNDALEHVDDSFENFSTPIFFVDYQMPQMSGLDFIQKMNPKCLCKVALVTGHHELVNVALEKSDVCKCSNKTIRVFQKPLDSQSLFDFIETKEGNHKL